MTGNTPSRIGPYEVLGVIGVGTTASVYKAQRAPSTRPVAVKVLNSRVASDPASADRFRREAQSMARLVHSNIAQVVDVGLDGDAPYLVMEYVDGSSLAQRIAAARLTPTEALYVIEEIAKALQFSHQHGVIHRDLNPRNVLVSPDLSVVKLADVGLSRAPAPSAGAGGATGTFVGLGAMQYTAPEQASGGVAADHRADIYALGMILYHGLTGQLPVGRVGLPSELNKDVPVSLDPIVLKCLASNPTDRYDSVGAFLADLAPLEKVTHHQLARELNRFWPTRALTGTSVGPVAPDAPDASGPATRIVIGAVAVVVVLIAVGLSVRWFRSAAPAAPQAAPAAAQAQTAAPTPAPAVPAKPAPAAGQTAATKDSTLAAEAAAALASLKADAGRSAPADALIRQRGWLARYGNTASAAEGLLLLADTQARAGQLQESLLTCRDVETRFRGLPPAAEALLRHAQLLQQVKASPEESLDRLAEIARDYPASQAFLPAMVLKAGLEDKLKLQAVDPQRGTSVPASLMTRRLVASRVTNGPAAMAALRQIASTYEDLKRFDQAAKTYVELGTRYPEATPDAWFAAAEIYERRLNDKAAAKAAYLKVPPASPRYRDAQSRAQKLR